jgi:flagellar biosynthesis GTPase FlhF
MAKIKVQAPDSATAMEEVIRRLGVDALIVSTKSVDGQIEMIATDDNQTTEADQVRTNRRSKSNQFKNFADVLGMKVSEFEQTERKGSAKNSIRSKCCIRKNS